LLIADWNASEISIQQSAISNGLLCRYQFSRALVQRHAASLFDLFADLELTKSGKSRLHQVLGAGRAIRLGEDVGDAGQFEARPHALAGGHPVPGRAGTRTTLLAPLVPLTVCGIVVPLRLTLTICLRASLVAFLDGGRDFVGFAVSDADIATAIPGDHQRAEAERPAALDDLGAAVDSHDGAFNAALIGLPIAGAAAAATPLATSSALAAASTALPAATTALTAAMLLMLGLGGGCGWCRSRSRFAGRGRLWWHGGF